MASRKRQPGDVVPNEEEAQRLARLLLTMPSQKDPRDFPSEVRRLVKQVHYQESDAYADAMATRVLQIIQWTVPSPRRAS